MNVFYLLGKFILLIKFYLHYDTLIRNRNITTKSLFENRQFFLVLTLIVIFNMHSSVTFRTSHSSISTKISNSFKLFRRNMLNQFTYEVKSIINNSYSFIFILMWMVKTICLWLQLKTFFCIWIDLFLAYLTPQEEQNLDLQV